MTHSTSQRFKFQYANEIVGTFVLLALLVLVISLAAVARSQKWTEPTKRVIVKLPAASFGMKEGAPVQVGGMVIGIVDKIHVDELGDITADVTLKGEYIRFIRTDSKFTVMRTYLVKGDAYLDVTLGQGIELPSPANVTAAADPEASEFLAEIHGNLEQSQKLLEAVNSPDGNIQQTLANMKQISGTLARGDGLAGRLLTNSNTATDFDKILPKVNDSLTEVNAVVKDLRKTSNSLSELADQETRQLPAVMEETRKTLEGIKAVLEDLQKTTAKLPEVVASTNAVLNDVHRTTDKLPGVMESVQTSLQGLPPLLLQIQETMRQTQRLVEGIEHHWLIGGSMEPDTNAKRIRPEDIGGGGQ